MSGFGRDSTHGKLAKIFYCRGFVVHLSNRRKILFINLIHGSAVATSTSIPRSAAPAEGRDPRSTAAEGDDDGELRNKPAHAVPLASARQHPENQKEN